MGFLEQIQEVEFLGGEFATWLIVETALERGPAEWGDIREAVIEILGPILLEGPGAGASQVAVRGEEVLNAPELRSALAEGKRVRRVKLLVTYDDEQWQGTLDAKTLEWRGVKVSVPPVPDLGEYALMRTQAFERLTQLLEEWFAAFLKRRLSDANWVEELEKIKRFARDGSNDAD